MICCESMCQLFSNTGKLEKKPKRTPGTILSYYQAGGCHVILKRFPMIKASRSRKFSRWIRKKIAKFEKQKSTIFPPWLPPGLHKMSKMSKKKKQLQKLPELYKIPFGSQISTPIWIDPGGLSNAFKFCVVSGKMAPAGHSTSMTSSSKAPQFPWLGMAWEPTNSNNLLSCLFVQ